MQAPQDENKNKKTKSAVLIFFGAIRQLAAEVGDVALATKLPFDEVVTLERSKEQIKAELGLTVLEIQSSGSGKPGSPLIRFSAQ